MGVSVHHNNTSVSDAGSAPLESLSMFDVVCNDVQKQLEIDSVAVSDHNNKQQLSDAGQQGQGKGAKEEKVCACVYLESSPCQGCSCLHSWYCLTETYDTPCSAGHLPFMAFGFCEPTLRCRCMRHVRQAY